MREEELRRERRPKCSNIRELRAALAGREPEIELKQGCKFQVKSVEDVRREREDAILGDEVAQVELTDAQRACASETRPNMQREVTRVRDEAEAKAAKARTLLETLTGRDADTGGPLEIDRTVRLVNGGGPLARPQIVGGVRDGGLVQRSRLKVNVMECRGLPKMDLIGTNEVYVNLEVGIEKWSSSIIESDNPKWAATAQEHYGESHQFALSRRPGQRTMMRLAVWDEDTGSRDDLIGSYLVELPLTLEEAQRRKGVDPYQDRGFMFPFSRIEGIDKEIWSSSCWYPLISGQGQPAGECHLKIKWTDWNSEAVEEGGEDDAGEAELIGEEVNASRPGSCASMSKEEWFKFQMNEKEKKMQFLMQTLIDVSRTNAEVDISGVEIVGSTICEGRFVFKMIDLY